MSERHKAFSDAVVLDSTATDKEVCDEMRDIWADKELGNDYYYCWFSLDDTFIDSTTEEELTASQKYPHLSELLKENNLFRVLLHFWW